MGTRAVTDDWWDRWAPYVWVAVAAGLTGTFLGGRTGNARGRMELRCEQAGAELTSSGECVKVTRVLIDAGTGDER